MPAAPKPVATRPLRAGPRRKTQRRAARQPDHRATLACPPEKSGVV